MAWTIDAVHDASVRLIIRELFEHNKLDQLRGSFFKAMEPVARRNVLPSAFYSIIEKGGA